MAENKELIRQAAKVLAAGGLVAFPTETVYGLGADARNASAVRKIFAVKGRPPTNPLIVHVANAQVARRYCVSWPEKAQRLTDALWPGPLTLVLPKSGEIVSEVTAGRPTVALRAPDHELAQRLLREFDGPIAAPSANRSTRPSPTTAQHVRDELPTGVDLILDGGPCAIGIESTVLDLTGKKPTILRPGSVSRDRIEGLIGAVDVFDGSVDAGEAAASPGMQEVHYAPSAPAYRFGERELQQVETFCRDRAEGSVAVLAIADTAIFERLNSSLRQGMLLEMPASPEAYARRLYAALHESDARNVDAIWIQEPPETAAWHAVRDRIRRATRRA